MIVERSMHPQFLSNTYLVAEQEGGGAFFVDAGGPVQPLIDAAERLRLTPTHVLLTHHHFDHVCETGALRRRWPSLQVLIDPVEREMLGDAEIVAEPLEAGEPLIAGGLEVLGLRTPGHTAGMLSFLVGSPGHAAMRARGDREEPVGLAVFTGDTLFKGSVGGVHAPGHTTYAELRDSIMGTLMELPFDTAIYPGHAEETTVAQEWESNPFIRVWRRLDGEGSSACVALGEQATLILLGPDYDGGTKAWVRWPDGSDDIVPGSQVQTS